MEQFNLVHQALEFAAKAHREQLRKGTDIPYIVHPMEAALILSQAGASECLIAAAILHDTLEDTDTKEFELEAAFGSEVTHLVKSMTKDEDLSWEENRQHSIDRLSTATKDEKMLMLADKLANLRSIAADYELLHDELWVRFNRGYADQKWYYTGISKALNSLTDLSAYQEYCMLVQYVFGS